MLGDWMEKKNSTFILHLLHLHDFLFRGWSYLAFRLVFLLLFWRIWSKGEYKYLLVVFILNSLGIFARNFFSHTERLLQRYAKFWCETNRFWLIKEFQFKMGHIEKKYASE